MLYYYIKFLIFNISWAAIYVLIFLLSQIENYSPEFVWHLGKSLHTFDNRLCISAENDHFGSLVINYYSYML